MRVQQLKHAENFLTNVAYLHNEMSTHAIYQYWFQYLQIAITDHEDISDCGSMVALAM
jgi:hypothetical protein